MIVVYDKYKNRIPIKAWITNLTDFEEECWTQLRALSNLPFAFRHISIMRDGHTGYGMPIGGVLVTTDSIVPNAVGVDVGCGMNALETSIFHLDAKQITNILSLIKKNGSGRVCSP